MKTVAIVQARMGSTRLPGKVLKDIGGRTMLARVIERTSRSKLIDRIVVATTTESVDEPVVAESTNLKVPIFRGSQEDVLDRYYRAAEEQDADPIVRITSDCPLVDPEVIDQVLALYRREMPDYASNVITRTFPLGLDVEVLSRDALARAWRLATKPFERAHVTPFIYQRPDRFRLAALRADQDYSKYRWTVDTPEDLEFVRAVYACLGVDGHFGWREILSLVEREPTLAAINRGVRQKALEEG
ncbi:MAG: hypothetical protein A3K68_07845 [Euryarchaeota archaeon RBG_16_68_13]|nr:MAG: hypothetical protein A3K68_07845 [Euryarchaeota archaeon RBG_16_68_13]